MSIYEDDPYWRHQYRLIDIKHAETMRTFNDDITKRAIELASLDRKIELSKRLEALAKIRDDLFSDQARTVRLIEHALSLPQHCKDEWRKSLNRISLMSPEADKELYSLLAKIEAYSKSLFDELDLSTPNLGPSPLANLSIFKTPSFNPILSKIGRKSEQYRQAKQAEKTEIESLDEVNLFTPNLRPSPLADLSIFKTPLFDPVLSKIGRKSEQYRQPKQAEKTEIERILSSLRAIIEGLSRYVSIRSRL
jgi:hypothetical protein